MKECLARRLRKAREDQGLTLRGLAQKIDISHSFLADIEAGRSMPSVETLDRIARALNVTVDYLLGRTDDKGTDEIRVGLHRTDGYDKPLPPEAVKSIEEFIDFVRKKYGLRPDQPKEADRGKDRKPEGPGEE